MTTTTTPATRRRRGPMPARVRAAYDTELARARSAGSSAERWTALERAHILSQPWVRPHVRAHVAMLGVAWRERDRREVTGQIVRLVVAGPGSATGRYPVGNSGRARVPATLPMPLPDDLAALLE
ncbi:MAG: hypothetical protein JWN29_42 [Acidimicrobiales bacterium]|nr:hypothetical protein [Acidimicrobiales bacterium]